MDEEIDCAAVLARCPVLIDLDSATLAEVVDRLVGALVEAGRLAPGLRDRAVEAVMERERQGNTALADGIAIPHGRLEVSGLVVAIGVHRSGLDCSAVDGRPSRIFVLMLSPAEMRRGHIRLLAAINRRLLLPDVRESVLMARDAGTVRELLASEGR